MKTINFISGLPRSGTTLLTNILKQNPNIHSETTSSLCKLFEMVNYNWLSIKENQKNENLSSKLGVLNCMIHGYYSHTNKQIVFDRNLDWIPLIGTLEEVLQKQVKMLVCVRNPAQILSSFEKLRKENPLLNMEVDTYTKGNSNIASRAYYYAGPEGLLGRTHRNLLDATTMGYNDRLLFVDYERYCNTPKNQTKRIYDFFEIPYYEHDFNNIQQDGLNKNKTELIKTTINCVEYLGLNLYEQYNREIFWNAWI